MDDERLTAIEARAKAATDGQWGWRPFGSDPENAIRIVSYPPGIEHWEVIADDMWVEANAEFIAASRTDVPDLVAEVRAERARADAAEARIERGLTYCNTADRIDAERLPDVATGRNSGHVSTRLIRFALAALDSPAGTETEG